MLREQQGRKAEVRTHIDDNSILRQKSTKPFRLVIEPQLAIELILDFLNITIAMEGQPIAAPLRRKVVSCLSSSLGERIRLGQEWALA
jgi:hypothetical protein